MSTEAGSLTMSEMNLKMEIQSKVNIFERYILKPFYNNRLKNIEETIENQNRNQMIIEIHTEIQGLMKFLNFIINLNVLVIWRRKPKIIKDNECAIRWSRKFEDS